MSKTESIKDHKNICKLENDWFLKSNLSSRIPDIVFKELNNNKVFLINSYNYYFVIFKGEKQDIFKDYSDKIIYQNILYNFSEKYPPYKQLLEIELKVVLMDYLTDRSIQDVLLMLEKIKETDFFNNLRTLGKSS